ncbi:MAG: hypothetical protein IKF07_01670 [Eubacterium sp.]|nr:hypothetical protein [Eubacterium sp.]
MIVMICLAAVIILTPYYAAGKTKQSSFEYKRYTEHEQYRKALYWRMNSVYRIIKKYMDDKTTLPIPGLVKTYSSSNGKGKMSDEFIPQGICRADKYWLVTAYDAKEKLNTVIYVVDPDKKKLVSTIALPNRYHGGGIAFDGENIWLTGDTSDKYDGDPFLQYIRFSDLICMIDKPLHIVTENEISKPVYIKNKPSFLEFDEITHDKKIGGEAGQSDTDNTVKHNEGTIWVGTYIGKSSSKEAYLYGYRLLRGKDEVKLNTILVSVIYGLDSSAQGVDIDGDSLYVSSSYGGLSIGLKSSFITKYNIRPIKEGRQNLSVVSREISRIEVPKMNEEILIEDDKVFINFESASEMWKNAVIMTDRILSLDKSLWN